MATSTRKRKRNVDDNDSAAGVEHEEVLRALFQQAFEAKFNPLQHSLAISKPDNEENPTEDEGDSDSEWSGLSADEEAVETIRHSASQRAAPIVEKHEQKAFMVRNDRI